MVSQAVHEVLRGFVPVPQVSQDVSVGVVGDVFPEAAALGRDITPGVGTTQGVVDALPLAYKAVELVVFIAETFRLCVTGDFVQPRNGVHRMAKSILT